MRKLTIGAAFLAAMALGVGSAGATKYEFKGDQGTRCVIEVGADASRTLQVLQAPRVGFSANPACTYPARSERDSAKGKAGAKAKRKSCRKPKRAAKPGSKKRGCKKKKKQGMPRTAYAAAAAPSPVTLRQAQLFLLGAGTVLPGDQTLATLGVGGYTCSVLPVSTCADQGNLSPATPEAPYQARYEVTVAPPPGERWVTVPGGCSAAAAPSCTLLSPSVVPMVL